MFSPRSFIVLIATFRSMIQINFVCAVSLMSKFTVFNIRIQLLQRYLKFSFLGELHMYLWQKSIYNLCESASAYSVLGHQSVFTSIPYSLGQYSFLVSQSCLCNEASIKNPEGQIFGPFWRITISKKQTTSTCSCARLQAPLLELYPMYLFIWLLMHILWYLCNKLLMVSKQVSPSFVSCSNKLNLRKGLWEPLIYNQSGRSTDDNQGLHLASQVEVIPVELSS